MIIQLNLFLCPHCCEKVLRMLEGDVIMNWWWTPTFKGIVCNGTGVQILKKAAERVWFWRGWRMVLSISWRKWFIGKTSFHSNWNLDMVLGFVYVFVVACRLVYKGCKWFFSATLVSVISLLCFVSFVNGLLRDLFLILLGNILRRRRRKIE